MKKVFIKTVVIGLLLAAGVLSLYGANQQITKIGVVDTKRIAETYFKDSKAYREIDELTKEVQKQFDEYKATISKLEQQKTDLETELANKKDEVKSKEVLNLENKIFNTKQLLSDYSRIKSNQLATMKAKLSQSDKFVRDLANALRISAEADGYSVIIDISKVDLLYFSLDVDITDKVIEYLTKKD